MKITGSLFLYTCISFAVYNSCLFRDFFSLIGAHCLKSFIGGGGGVIGSLLFIPFIFFSVIHYSLFSFARYSLFRFKFVG